MDRGIGIDPLTRVSGSGRTYPLHLSSLSSFMCSASLSSFLSFQLVVCTESLPTCKEEGNSQGRDVCKLFVQTLFIFSFADSLKTKFVERIDPPRFFKGFQNRSPRSETVTKFTKGEETEDGRCLTESTVPTPSLS